MLKWLENTLDLFATLLRLSWFLRCTSLLLICLLVRLILPCMLLLLLLLLLLRI